MVKMARALKCKVFLLSLLFSIQIHGTYGQSVATGFVSIQDTISQAVTDYNDGNYQKCIKGFETGLVHYRMLKHIDMNCGLRCATPDIQKELNIDMPEFDDLTTYGNLIAQANCIKVCKEEHHFSAKNIERPTPAFARDLENRRPYNYLQFAYYQTNRMKQATQAAYTYFQVNPHDQQMKENLEFYKGLEESQDDWFIDLEGKSYSTDFIEGVSAYGDKEYKTAVDKIEKALINYLQTYEECKVLCYYGRPTLYFFRLHQDIAAKYFPAVNCTEQCERKLRPLFGDDFLDNFVAKCFSYLQFSYYQLDNWAMAAPAAASVLLLDPSDQHAQSNYDYYLSQAKENNLSPEIHFKPRADAMKYHLEVQTTKQLLELISKSMDFQDEVELDPSEENERASLPDSLIEEIRERITVTIGKQLRGDIG